MKFWVKKTGVLFTFAKEILYGKHMKWISQALTCLKAAYRTLVHIKVILIIKYSTDRAIKKICFTKLSLEKNVIEALMISNIAIRNNDIKKNFDNYYNGYQNEINVK